MDSLGHLKTKYRSRYFNREGPRQDVGLQGENVLKYIQGCFETCAKDFTVYSPTLSCSSSSSFEKDQDGDPFQSEDKEQPEPQIHVQNAFNTITCLPSSSQKDISPGENDSEDEDEERQSTSHILDGDDFDISLGSPALLLEEEKCGGKPSTSQCEGMLNSGEDKFVFAVNVDKDKDVTQSEMCHERKETKELSAEKTKSTAASSHQNKMSESLASSEDLRTSFMQRNTANVDPEDDCEFVIEESFGISSKSWISASQKKQKPQKKSLISAQSRQKREVSQHSARKKDKRTSEKHVTPTAIKHTKLSLTNVAETAVNELKNISGTNEIMSLVDDQPLLVLNTIQEGKQKIHSKGKVSEEISSKISASINQTEDHAALLEEDNSFSEQPQAVLRTAERSPNSKRTVKHKHSKRKTSIARQNEGSQERASVITASENSRLLKNIGMCSENSVSVLKPILSVEPAEQKSSNEKSPAKQKSSSKKSPAKQKSSNKKALKRQKPVRTVQSKQQQETQNSLKESIIRASKRKRRILVSEKSSESEHGDEQCNKGVEKHCSYELKAITNSRKPSQKIRQTSLVSSEDSDCEGMSCEEDSSEQYLTEKRLYSSLEQQNSATSSLQSFSPSDVNMINTSGPLDNKAHFECKETFDSDESGSDDSGDFMGDSGGLVPNSLKHKLVLPTNTPNVRRTKRMRIKPLEYWRGERVDYKTRPSGGFVIHGIISPEQKEPRKSKPKKTVNPVVELDNSVPDTSMTSLKDPDQPAVVFDAASNQEVLLECVKSGSSHMFFISNEAVSIYKYLSTPCFSAGKMVLKPLKEKGYQYSHTDTLVFHISQGKLLLNLYDQCYCLTAGDYFFIPPGNIYNIRNLLNQECVIRFTQLKGRRPES